MGVEDPQWNGAVERAKNALICTAIKNHRRAEERKMGVKASQGASSYTKASQRQQVNKQQTNRKHQSNIRHTQRWHGQTHEGGDKNASKATQVIPNKKNETNNRVIIYTTKFLVQSHCQALALQQDRTQ
jgi:hypothetical protein